MSTRKADDRTALTPTSEERAPSTQTEIDGFLAELRSRPAAPKTGERRGRLLFVMDATMSRQPTWDTAQQIQGEMFRETARIGGLDVQLLYFRGFNECRASKWVGDPEGLSRLMTQVDCRGGHTQIGKSLMHVLKETQARKVDAVVYVGDCMEENVDSLCRTAGEIGMHGTPVFMFQEGDNAIAQVAFREIARLTRGAYCRFDQGSAKQLRELLSAVAVYAAGGRAALLDYGKRKGGESLLLLEQLKGG